MLKLSVQVEFAEVLAKLRKCEAEPSDFGKLIEIVRENRNEISDEIKLQILSISLHVLKERCELKCNRIKWACEHGNYFADNCVHLEEWKERFACKSYDLETMCEFMEYILEDADRLNNAFYLRNPEVTLRDYVHFTDAEWYKDEQIIYAMVLENALMK